MYLVIIKIYEAKTDRIEVRNRDSSTIITGDFNPPLSVTVRTTRQEVS